MIHGCFYEGYVLKAPTAKKTRRGSRLSLGTKKDATYFFVVGHEPTQPYFPLNILDF